VAVGCVNIVDGNGWGFAVNGTSEVFPKTFSCQRPVASAKTQAQNGTELFVDVFSHGLYKFIHMLYVLPSFARLCHRE
jgi:hypothetical protein